MPFCNYNPRHLKFVTANNDPPRHIVVSKMDCAKAVTPRGKDSSSANYLLGFLATDL